MKGDEITLAHGSGGRLMRELIEEVIVPIFDNPALRRLEDASFLELPNGGEIKSGSLIESQDLVMTTDSYVVKPPFFPGGDVGKLSVCGTVNDLATAGAIPVALSVGLIIEEGFLLDDLRKILISMKNTADAIPVPIITGDTKVVEKGRGDGLFVNTTGIGRVRPGVLLDSKRVKPGDAVLINGSVGNHEAAILCSRHEFSFNVDVSSDCAPLHRLMQRVLEAVPELKWARDPTRGGVTAVLSELVEAAGVRIILDEESLAVEEGVRGICEILGLDPLIMANEGKMILIVPGDRVSACLEAMRSVPEGKDSRVIGEVQEGEPRLVMRTAYGTHRIITMPAGSQFPRIC
jgi:hydrogenase expression/formation protein HypE